MQNIDEYKFQNGGLYPSNIQLGYRMSSITELLTKYGYLYSVLALKILYGNATN